MSDDLLKLLEASVKIAKLEKLIMLLQAENDLLHADAAKANYYDPASDAIPALLKRQV